MPRPSRLLAAACVAAVACLLVPRALSEDQDEAPKAARPPLYQVVIYTPGEKWDDKKAFQEQPAIDEHVKYLESLQGKGHLRLGGPFLDGAGGLVVLQGVKPEQAKEIVAADPAVKAGTLSGKTHPWLVPLHAEK